MRKIEEILNNRNFHPIDIITDDSKEDGFALRVNGYFYDPVSQKRYYVIFTSSLGWEHASVSQPNKTPTWDVMCRVKDLFWAGDECCIEYHPKEEDYINMHEHCLHIWKPIGVELPMPPSIMVGLKGFTQEDVHVASQIIINSMSEQEQLDRSGVTINRKMRRRANGKN